MVMVLSCLLQVPHSGSHSIHIERNIGSGLPASQPSNPQHLLIYIGHFITTILLPASSAPIGNPKGTCRQGCRWQAPLGIAIELDMGSQLWLDIYTTAGKDFKFRVAGSSGCQGCPKSDMPAEPICKPIRRSVNLAGSICKF